jgi:hypothetical protein
MDVNCKKLGELIDQKIQWNDNIAQWDKYRINCPDSFDEWSVFTVIQPQRLESRLYGMIKMESQDDDQDDIHDRIQWSAEKVYRHIVKIMRVGNHVWALRRGSNPQLDKIEVDEMNKQKDKDDDSGMNHILAKE